MANHPPSASREPFDSDDVGCFSWVQDDPRPRGLSSEERMAGIKPVRSTELTTLFHGFQRIWRW
jgi:hypothetical protein